VNGLYKALRVYKPTSFTAMLYEIFRLANGRAGQLVTLGSKKTPGHWLLEIRKMNVLIGEIID
jgi:hypothetical protein